MTKKFKDLRNRIDEKVVKAMIQTRDGEEEHKFPLLTNADWAIVKDETGVDVWTALLNTSIEVDPGGKMSDEDRGAAQRKATIEFLKGVPPKAQSMIIFRSLQQIYPDVELEDVDYVITHGMNQSDYLKVINFILYGVSSEQAQEQADLKNELAALEESVLTDTPDELLIGVE